MLKLNKRTKAKPKPTLSLRTAHMCLHIIVQLPYTQHSIEQLQ